MISCLPIKASSEQKPLTLDIRGDLLPEKFYAFADAEPGFSASKMTHPGTQASLFEFFDMLIIIINNDLMKVVGKRRDKVVALLDQFWRASSTPLPRATRP